MKVQLVTPCRVLQRYGVTVRGNVTSVYPPLQGQASGLISNLSIDQARSQGGGGGAASDKSGCKHMEFTKYCKTTNTLTSPLIIVRRTAHTRCLF